MKIGVMLRITDINAADQQFQTLKKQGFDTCQLVYKPEVYHSADAVRIRRAADHAGVEISALFAGYYDTETIWDNYYGFLTAGLNVEAYRAERLRYVSAAASFVHDLGISDMVIHAGYVPNNPFAPEYASMKTAVEQLSSRCQALGINLLFETGGESPVVLLRLIEEIGRNNLFINLDPANLLMYGFGNPVDAVYTFGSYVRSIHGKDGLPPTTARELGKETPIGAGMVDFPRMLAMLHDKGYDGCIIIEREISGPQQQKDIQKAKVYFETLVKKIWK